MIPQIRPNQLAAWLESVKALGVPLVLDVREPAEWQAASVTADGFDLVTMSMGSVPQRLGELDTGRPVACLCHHGARSQRVAAFLSGSGFSQVVNIAGGIDAWSQELDKSIARY
jgi:rhodanese-related sulfurtransferase